MNQYIEKERYDMNDFRKRSGQPKKSGAAAKRGQGKSGRPASANGFSSPRKSSGAANAKPYYQTKLQGRTGAQPGDYVIISDGKQEITTRVNLASHPFCKKKVGDRVEAGEAIAEIHAADMEGAQRAAEDLVRCYEFSEAPVQRAPLIKQIIM